MITEIIHTIAEVCHFINPFIILVACFLWIKLYSSTQSQCNQMYLRQYVLEQQVEYLVSNREIDPVYINMLKELKDRFEDKRK